MKEVVDTDSVERANMIIETSMLLHNFVLDNDDMIEDIPETDNCDMISDVEYAKDASTLESVARRDHSVTLPDPAAHMGDSSDLADITAKARRDRLADLLFGVTTM